MPFINWRLTEMSFIVSKGNPIVNVRAEDASKATAALMPLLYFNEQKAEPVGAITSLCVAA